MFFRKKRFTRKTVANMFFRLTGSGISDFQADKD